MMPTGTKRYKEPNPAAPEYAKIPRKTCVQCGRSLPDCPDFYALAVVMPKDKWVNGERVKYRYPRKICRTCRADNTREWREENSTTILDKTIDEQERLWISRKNQTRV